MTSHPHPPIWTDAATVCEDAFVFAFPLVLMELARAHMTAVAKPEPATMRAPPNRLVHAHATTDAATLRTAAWLDLGDGPVLLTVPETRGRYSVVSLLDMWTNTVASIGARTTGTGAGAFAIFQAVAGVPVLPAGVTPIAAPGRHLRLTGRTCLDQSRPDADAGEIRDGYAVRPLAGRATWRGARRLRPGAVDPRWPAGAASPADAVDRLDGQAFFALACSLVPEHRPPAADRHVLDRAAPLGLFTACDEPWPGDAAARAAAAGAERGKASMLAEAAREGRDADGRWQIDYRHGDFGTDYLCRAVASRTLFDADVAVDALPAATRVDADGQPLSGSARYLLRFAPDQLPPVHGFWAVGARGGSVSLGDRDGLTMDADGSLSICIQHARPVRAERVNWLPVPAGPFTLLLRLHWPADEVLRGRWAPPPVKRVA